VIKNNILGTIISAKNPQLDFYLFQDLYKRINLTYKKFYYINLYYLLNSKAKIKKYKYPKNFIKFEPKDYKELVNFLKKNNLISFISLSKKFNNLYIYYLLQKYNVKLILNFSIGYYKQNNFFIKKNKIIFSLINFYKFLLFYKLPKLIFRILLFFKLMPVYDIIFVASRLEQKILNQISKSRINIFKLNIPYFKKVVKINSRSYDNLLKRIHSVKEKYIVFLDSGFDHNDVINQEGPHTNSDRKKYYLLLNNVFNKFEKLYKKKLIVCLHPKTDEVLVKKYIKNFKIIKFKTQKYIIYAYMILFHESSSVLDAIMLKKRIVNLQSPIMGAYYHNRNNYYPKKINIPAIKMENFNGIKKEKLDIFFKNRNTLYNNYIQNFLDFNVKKYSNLFTKKKINIKKFTESDAHEFGYQKIISYINCKYKIN
jgi:hypothetical protein